MIRPVTKESLWGILFLLLIAMTIALALVFPAAGA